MQTIGTNQAYPFCFKVGYLSDALSNKTLSWCVPGWCMSALTFLLYEVCSDGYFCQVQ